jgi:hypothetical protein
MALGAGFGRLLIDLPVSGLPDRPSDLFLRSLCCGVSLCYDQKIFIAAYISCVTGWQKPRRINVREIARWQDASGIHPPPWGSQVIPWHVSACEPVRVNIRSRGID